MSVILKYLVSVVLMASASLFCSPSLLTSDSSLGSQEAFPSIWLPPRGSEHVGGRRVRLPQGPDDETVHLHWPSEAGAVAQSQRWSTERAVGASGVFELKSGAASDRLTDEARAGGQTSWHTLRS